MSTLEFLHALDDFNQWYSDQRQRLIERGASAQAMSEFTAAGETVRALVNAYLANGESNIQRVKIETLKSKHNLFKVVNFFAAFKGFTGTRVRQRELEGAADLLSLLKPSPVEQLGSRDQYESYAGFAFGEADGERHVVSTLPTTDPNMIERFQQSGNAPFYSITGILLPNPLTMEFEVLPLTLKLLSTPLDLVEATPAEYKKAENVIAEANGVSLLNLIAEEVCQAQGIIDSGDPMFMEALEVSILQASSHGLMNGESARIHDLVIGPPGSGKGKIAKVGAALQPVSKRVEPQALTEDGLYGGTGSSGGRRVVRAGLIPQANEGVFIIEDFHQANALKNRRLTTSFSYTMETGRCEAANASRTSYDAQVAFHIDSNRLSDVDPRRFNKKNMSKGLARVTEDTGLPSNVLTRLDYICELPRDPKRQLELSLMIARTPLSEQSENARSTTRLLQVIIALLRTKIPMVSIDAEVAEYMEKRFRSIINVRLEVLFAHPDYSDFMSRGPKSYKKFVAAHARLCNRNAATKEDVDAVFKYVLRKFDTVLGWIVGDTDQDSDQSARKDARQTFIRIRFRDQKVRLEAVHKHLTHVTMKTIRRDVEEIGATRNEDGTWTIPAMNAA
ncbi:MAG: hypothetical protein WCT04_13120 [Planctomycetota bacterium]